MMVWGRVPHVELSDRSDEVDTAYRLGREKAAAQLMAARDWGFAFCPVCRKIALSNVDCICGGHGMVSRRGNSTLVGFVLPRPKKAQR